MPSPTIATGPRSASRPSCCTLSSGSRLAATSSTLASEAMAAALPAATLARQAPPTLSSLLDLTT